jgi:hypothetical protein
VSRSRWSASWATRTATLLGSLWLAGLPGLDAAHAAVFTVTNTDDSGAGSLRQAILDANAALGEDTILFTLPADSVITLATDLADLTEAVTFDATGASGLVVDGDGANRILGTAGADVGWIDLNAEMGDIELGDGDAFTFTANNDGEIAADIHDADLAPTTPRRTTSSGCRRATPG